MNYTEEMIIVESQLPIKIFLHERATGIVPKHWHNSLEISYLIEGKTKSYINGVERKLESGEMEIINIGDVHSYHPEDSSGIQAVVLLIPKELFKDEYSNIDNVIFNISNEEDGFKLKEIVKNIGYTYKYDSSDFKNIRIKGYIYELMYTLLTYCKEEKTNKIFAEKKQIERMSNITTYIKNNYREELSLEGLAIKYGVSREHLSRIFKEHVGITFIKYIESVRLYHAHRDLLNTDESVIQIALENGFPNVKSFITAFKNNYGNTPSKYRKEIKI